jgi:hypothetical protein
MRRIDFVVGGAQKAGTTTLAAYLGSHAAVGMSRVKETHFFDDEDRNWISPDYSKFHCFFDPGKQIYGEATPITLYWTPAQYRLREYNPTTKLILIFRDPIDRAFSNWKMIWHASQEGLKTANGEPPERLLFGDAIRCGRQRMLDSQELPGLNRWSAYIERGFYGLQLKHLLKVFPSEQLLYLDFNDLSIRPGRVLDKISAFLGIDRNGFTDRTLLENASPRMEWPSRITSDDITYMGRLFSNDLEIFVKLSGIDISSWRSSQFLK